MNAHAKIPVRDGTQIPAVAVGTFTMTGDECYNAVLEALKMGYRHIDTASFYENEDAVGRAIRDSGVPREELYVTTKLTQNEHRQAEKSLDASLKRLGLDYVDSFLMHWPLPQINGERDPEWTFVDTWRAMLALPKDKVRTVGVSNFSTVNLGKLEEASLPLPPVNQIELHPLCQQDKLVNFCKAKGIVCTAYCPLARGDNMSINVLEHPTVQEIAHKHGVTPGQVVLSWGVWRGTPVLPKSANPSRLRTNFAIIPLSDDEGKQISAIGAGKAERIVPDPEVKYPVTIFHDDADL